MKGLKQVIIQWNPPLAGGVPQAVPPSKLPPWLGEGEGEMFLDGLSQAARRAVGSALGELAWYVLLASAAYLFFYVAFRARLRHRRVSPRDPAAGQMRREVAHSLRSIAVFGLVTLAVLVAAGSGLTRLYGRVDRYGWGWFFASIAVMVVLHDTWFYWTHRLLHHRRLFRLIHRTHHLSTSPTPWAAYAFSPVEALIQAGVGPLIVFTIPTHPAAFAAFMVWQVAFNVLGHCGYEIFPAWFLRSPAGWVLNSVTHHAQHHEKFRANYGLYFNVWDRLMGTNHPDYQRRFAQAASGPGAAPAEAPGESESRRPGQGVRAEGEPDRAREGETSWTQRTWKRSSPPVCPTTATSAPAATSSSAAGAASTTWRG
jgi:sterol desaturase/sphingolipid hydroxylase (fatty acid hydroxylase superfamily)